MPSNQDDLEESIPEPEDSKFATMTKAVYNVMFLPVVFSVIAVLVFHYYDTLIESQISLAINDSKPLYWLYTKKEDEGHLRHVIKVLDKLGYRRGTNESDWDLLWAHDYPFKIFPNLKNLKPHQRVNHLPACGFFTNKVDLSTTDSQYLPRAFRLPDDKEAFLDFTRDFPEKRFVQKSNAHRGIRIKKSGEFDFDKEETFIQEFVEKPYLVDGFKFDMGIYTVITSVDPLRVYTYKGDVLFRFCPHTYHPFDPEDTKKYVVDDDYLPIWKVPSLKKFYTDLGFSMKDTFDAYVRSTGKDPGRVWNAVDEAIRDVLLKKEKLMGDVVKKYPGRKNFFELVRFDFIVDDQLNIFLMEANMSPNLSSAHFPPNRLLYEQVLFNMFALIGVGQRIDTPFIRPGTWEERSFEVADKNLVVLPEICSACADCFRVECQLCRQCFTEEMRSIFAQCYTEHQNKMDFKRVFPPPITKDMILKDYTLKNQLLVRWYQGKCQMDASWCT
ncbi:tubulin polyglutamylase TTLL6 isoform X2 [Fopius arisanus]|uniref:Tubulin polyglutamylase TTLL6 isoform X2 n=1 Tax=Fopius arisanus TaxID=64838 RepID=A0A9R1T3B8_9HYME|nr:PREDICTED: tubulin polyglutamylase TTLL6 isoform X2 [Fopius arisanus]